MAHTQIKGLPLYPFDADFFSDERMICIDGEFGAKGALTAVALLCAIYRNGYFARWEAGLKYRLRREICGVSLPFLEMVVGALVRRGFFDKGLFDSDEILTSIEIQRRYFGAGRSSQWDPALPYLLLSEEDFSSDMGDMCLPASEEKDFCENPPTPPYSRRLNNNNIINNYNISSTMERKEYGGTGEKENPETSHAEKKTGGAEKKTEMAGFIAELKESPQWLEQMGMKHGLSLKGLYGRLDEYLLFCQCEGKDHATLRDVKSHFNRWLSKRIEYQKNQIENETVREDRFARRRGTDTKAKSAGDYTTSF